MRPHLRVGFVVTVRVAEPFAEFLGVAILIIFGAGVNCQVLSPPHPVSPLPPKACDYLVVSFGWAVGLSLGVWVSSGISPAHINPAVTLAMATWRGFPWKKVPGFIFAQTLGGFIGAAIVYANYFRAIDIFEGSGIRTMKTAGVFGAYAARYLTDVSAFFSEHRPTPGLFPLVIFLAILGISSSLGMQTGTYSLVSWFHFTSNCASLGFSLNPARDFGPRLLSAAVGYPGVFSYRHQYWLWTGILGPVVGAQLAIALYDTFLYEEDDSILYRLQDFQADRSVWGRLISCTL
ncbi:aquaporin-like protein [Mycena leptocephala]|nr:aquaporin-like protein [Mycena leptocephala]